MVFSKSSLTKYCFAGAKFLLTVYAVAGLVLFADGQAFVSKKARMNEESNHFLDASETYKGLYKSGNREAALRAARNLYKARHYDEALPLFEFAESLKIIDEPEMVFAFFECLKAAKRYEDADKLVREHVKEFNNKPEFGINDDKLAFYNKIGSYSESVVKPVGLNSPYSDIGPVVYKGWMYFGSTRPTTSNKDIHRINMQPFYNLLASPVAGGLTAFASPAGGFGAPEQNISVGEFEAVSLPDGLNRKHHDAPVYVTQGGNLLFITTNWSPEKRPKAYKHLFNLMIYYCEKQGNTWTEPKALPFNNFEWNTQHPWFDEASKTLYFSSNRPGGKGGYDLYKTVMMADGTWSPMQNLGDKINTSKEEVFPSLTPDNHLVFASNGWSGLGGLDAFLYDDETGRPLNLLAGINTESDDFYLYFTSAKTGYMNSNRKGGAGDDDIYDFEADFNLDRLREYNLVQGPVRFVAQTESSAPVNAAAAAVAPGGAARTFQIPGGGATQVLVSGSEVRITAEGFMEERVTITDDIIRKGPDEPVVVSMRPTPEAIAAAEAARRAAEEAAARPRINLRPVYFDYNSARIRKDGAKALDSLVRMMKENKDWKIEVGAHCDCRGLESRNQKLSDKRAEAVVNYVSKKLGEKGRISGKGFGETQLVNHCACNGSITSKCTESEYAANRRTEFVVIAR